MGLTQYAHAALIFLLGMGTFAGWIFLLCYVAKKRDKKCMESWDYDIRKQKEAKRK